MKYFFFFCGLLLMSCAADVGQNGAVLPDAEPAVSRLSYPYAPSRQCEGCHADHYMQYEESMHAKAFTNPLFFKQYFSEVVPRAMREPELVPEARKCIACHAPTVFMNYTGLVSTPEMANRFETGVTCDFCHTLSGYADNGDYLQNPSGKKQGPFQTTGPSSHHSEYSGFVQIGEFCGRCHNATNHIGLDVKSTYDEWRESIYNKRGIVCQDCHMNKNGFLLDGIAEFDKGQAAQMNVGQNVRKQKEHERLYNHAFPGAHSVSELQDALLLDFKVGTRAPDAEGKLAFTLLVNNERSGHKMPSGSSDLRFMWLVVTATAPDGTAVPVTLAETVGKVNDYSIAGASPDDAGILQNDVPAGARLYRTVLVNADGRQSLYQYDAVKNVFDNRLNAAEIRKEQYVLKLPALFSGKVRLEANLYYRSAPSSFARRMQIEDSGPVTVASQKKVFIIEMPHVSN